MLCVSLTFDLVALHAVLARPGLQLLATGLVYGPMSLAGYALGRVAFGSGPLGLGVTLVGTLPTDVSSPLLVLIARGNVALATVFNAVNTILAPVLVPGLSKKEFSIAAFLVFSSGLPAEVALPAVVYAVVQMITSPLAANRLAHR